MVDYYNKERVFPPELEKEIKGLIEKMKKPPDNLFQIIYMAYFTLGTRDQQRKMSWVRAFMEDLNEGNQSKFITQPMESALKRLFNIKD